MSVWLHFLLGQRCIWRGHSESCILYVSVCISHKKRELDSGEPHQYMYQYQSCSLTGLFKFLLIFSTYTMNRWIPVKQFFMWKSYEIWPSSPAWGLLCSMNSCRFGWVLGWKNFESWPSKIFLGIELVSNAWPVGYRVVIDRCITYDTCTM
jgi:hypothetical protein